jgi:hypothetical protein
MQDLAQRAQEWRDIQPLKRWRQTQAYSTQQAALVLDMVEKRIEDLETGDPPTDHEMKTITQRTGITQAQWTTWERAIPGGPAPGLVPFRRASS